MQRKKLPIGIQTFREIRENLAYYYVDKTPFALQLVDQGKHYFLSRPRRFGKSLFLDTLKELFEGHQALFTGLYAEQHWDWSVKYPVLRISFGGGVHKQVSSLEAVIHEQLAGYEARWQITAHLPDMPSRLKRLIQNIHQQVKQRVVVLIDEYDKPILDNLAAPEIAREMRDVLRSFYSVLKDNDAHLKFVFITGVSKFSKVSLFSGLNNLKDITVDKRFSALCGYTEADLDTVFAPELPGQDRAAIRRWYNGYNWSGEAVYNPFDLLLYFDRQEFRAFWFETGSPTFLIDFLAQNKWFTPELMRLEANTALLSRFDVGDIQPEALLWQTGYLTFHKVEEILTGHWIYTLGYPNREVEAALNESLLPAYGPEPRTALTARSHLIQALQRHDLKALEHSIHTLFAGIPYEWYRKNPLAQFEGHYASVFYSQLAALGLNVQPEDITSKGRIDLSLRLGQRVYLFEFKVTDEQHAGEALQQLIDRNYADKYRAPDVAITLIGIAFSPSERNVVGFESLTLEPSA
ncbi:MAG: ATP-binding protein [Candidatus Sericytochromatia bacterium]|nr:ATP-binding protein [Candidatus Sericytochromatia bacterium]